MVCLQLKEINPAGDCWCPLCDDTTLKGIKILYWNVCDVVSDSGVGWMCVEEKSISNITDKGQAARASASASQNAMQPQPYNAELQYAKALLHCITLLAHF